LKFLTWNCNGAFREKFKSIASYDADVYVIQECENPEKVDSKYSDYHLFSKNYFWNGSNKNKGLGVFAKDTITIEKLNLNHIWRGRELQWFLPLRINSSINLLAVWNHHADAEAFQYMGQFWLFMQNNKAEFQNMIIAGDFNSNSIWDKWDRWWNHTDCVNELSQIDILSVYHQLKEINHGSEVENTFFLHRNESKGYHIDYFFANRKYIDKTKKYEVGNFMDWKKKSDHVPIFWEF